MKKSMMFGLVVFAVFVFGFVGAVSAESVSSVLDNMISSPNGVTIVYGDNANPTDAMASNYLASYLRLRTPGKNVVQSASEIGNYVNKNLILVGGPCANQISSDIVAGMQGYECKGWKFGSGQSLVKVFDNGQGKVILISGTNWDDTMKVIDAFKYYKNSTRLGSSDEIVFSVPQVNSVCGNGICEAGETSTTCSSDCIDTSKELISGGSIGGISISGDILAFSSLKQGQPLPQGEASSSGSNYYSESYIYYLNLSSMEQTQIAPGYYPSISGNNIVFDNNNILSIYNLQTKSLENINMPTGYNQVAGYAPLIYNNTIVYVGSNGNPGNKSSAFEYNIETRINTKLFDVSWFNFVLEGIYENEIVYTDYSGKNSIISMYDLDTKQTTQISNKPFIAGGAKIDGNLIVWDDGRDQGEGIPMEIRYYNISSGQESLLNISKEGSVSPTSLGYNLGSGNLGYDFGGLSGGVIPLSFSDGRLLFQSFEGNNTWDIYSYDFNTGVERRVSVSGRGQGQAFSGNNVVWRQNINGYSTEQNLHYLKFNFE